MLGGSEGARSLNQRLIRVVCSAALACGTIAAQAQQVQREGDALDPGHQVFDLKIIGGDGRDSIIGV